MGDPRACQGIFHHPTSMGTGQEIYACPVLHLAGDGSFQSAFGRGPMNEVQSVLMTTEARAVTS
jgi:hypothetical protein